MSQTETVDKLILEYLDKRGLSATSKQLRAESQIAPQPMSLAPNRGLTGVVSDLLQYLAASGQASQYARNFDSLASWVDNSLDMYQHELSQILYPIFIHCCIQLVKKESANEATQMIGRYSDRFTKIDGQPSKLRMQEISELQALSVPEHLSTNRVAQALLKNRYPVRMCTSSYQLLMHFLEGAHLHLILAIVNERLKLEVEEGLPKDIADASEKETSLLSGDMEGGTSDVNLSDINLNLLKGLAEDKYATEKASEEAVKIPDQDEDGKPLTKKERMARQRAATRAKEALVAAEADRMEPEIPLPVSSDVDLEEQIADIKARVELSSTALPSAAFFTFVNTHQSLDCVAFNQSGSLVAGGFGDASVRVYDMKKTAAASSDKASSEDGAGEEMTEFCGHSSAVYGLDFSPDSELLFSASGDGTLRLWHLPLATCLNSYSGHMFPVWDCAANPHGTYFASAGADRTARIWSVERNCPLRILAGHYADVDAVKWHPNAHYIATGSSDHTVRLWDIRDGQAQRVLIGHRASVTALAFHPNGSTLATADEDGVVLCWDLAQGKRLATGSRHKAAVWSLSYSSGTGSLLASGGADDCLKLWDASSTVSEGSELPFLKTLSTKATPVFAAHFTPRNLLLASGALTLLKRSKR